MPEVRLVDLEVIKRFSLAVRQETAAAEAVLDALDASRVHVLASLGVDATAPPTHAAPAKKQPAKKPATKKQPARKAAARKAAARKQPAKKKAAARKQPAKKKAVAKRAAGRR